MQQNNVVPGHWTDEQFLQMQAALIELSHDAILVRNPENHIISWNRGAEELYGWTAEVAVGQVTHTLLQTEFPESLEVVGATLAQQSHWEGELVHTRADGARLEVESRQVLVRNENGRPLMILEVNRDITAQKAELVRLSQLNLELQRSNQELQDFAYVASHDLQEPLRKIQAFGNLLQEEYAESLGDGKEYLNRMSLAAARMRRLIDDLLTFSRVTTHASPFTNVDLNIIAREVVDDLEVPIRALKATVTLDDLPTLHADPSQMRQLLQNLIGNALKFHQRDVHPVVRVYSEISSESEEKQQTTSDEKVMYRIFVEDNGIGFEEKYLDRIFTVFQRLHGRGTFEGTGIGLAVVRKIVERHGGTVTATSMVDEGSIFIVSLPVVA